jgi:hypothetical protein
VTWQVRSGNLIMQAVKANLPGLIQKEMTDLAGYACDAYETCQVLNTDMKQKNRPALQAERL